MVYNRAMKRILLKIQYAGTNFFGWQKQPKKRTVQGELEAALKIVCNENVEVFASGRTDAGVHALGQCAHFDCPVPIPPSKLKEVLNSLLPDDITILSAKEVAEHFHARFDVKKKMYRYRIYIGSVKDSFLLPYAEWVKYPLDLAMMKKAAKVLIGEHDFHAFCASATAVSDFVRTIYSIKIIKPEENPELLDFFVEGNGFLYNMVRIIVGTLIDVGRGKMTVESVEEALKSGDRQKAGVTMPAKGLYLFSVKY